MFEVEEEPVPGAVLDPTLLRLSGLELLQTYLRGYDQWAPVAHLTGMHPTHFDAGAARSVMPLSEWLCSSEGSISSGALILPADSALASAVHTTLPAATLFTTAEVSVTWVRAVGPGGQVIADGQAVHTDETMGLSAVRLTDDHGQLVAYGTSRCTVLPPLPMPTSPAPAPELAPARSSRPDPYLRPVDGEVLDRDTRDRSSGEELLAAQLRGELPRPPFHHLFGLTLVEVMHRAAVFSVPCTRWLCGPVGNVQGGVLALLAQTAHHAAAQTTAGAGVGLVPLDLKVNLLRPVPPDGRVLRARGHVVHQGRSYVVAEAEVTNADGKRVALATGSVAYRHPG